MTPSPSPEARRLLESLSEQTLLRIVTENARVGLVIFSPDRRYIYANSAYADMLGLRGLRALDGGPVESEPLVDLSDVHQNNWSSPSGMTTFWTFL